MSDDQRKIERPVTGLVVPELAEALVRVAWPTLPAVLPGPLGWMAGLGRRLTESVVLAPLGWLIMAPGFSLAFAPFVCRRYALTNRRLMVQRGLRPRMVAEVKLADIDDVRLVPGSFDAFFRSGTLEVIGAGGKVLLTLPGVPEPEGFGAAVRNTVKAWVPGKATGAFVPASRGG